MAEPAGPPHRRRRRLSPEEEEVAEAVPGAMPERQQRGPPNQWALWRGGNDNLTGPTHLSRFERDTDIIMKLRQSGRVSPAELFSYRIPAIILDQGDRIDPINAQILNKINNMAFSRRMVLHFKIKRKSGTVESKNHELRLALFSAEIRHLQGLVEGSGGRYLRIPAVLLSPIELAH